MNLYKSTFLTISLLNLLNPSHAGNAFDTIVNLSVGQIQQHHSDQGHDKAHGIQNPHFGHGSQCHDENRLRSMQGNVHTQMQFINRSHQEVRTYWLDYSGRRVFYKAIPPNGSYTQPTYQTHPWVVTNQANNCIGIFISNRPFENAEIR